VTRTSAIAIFLTVLLAGATLAWVALDRLPPNWDDAWYLTNSLTVYDALALNGVAGYLAKLNSTFGFKAPLIAALPAPFYLVFGRRWHAAYLVNIAAMLVLFTALFRIAGHWWNRRAAVFAIAIAGTMPLLYGLARWYMVEYVLTAVLAAAVCLLIESDGLKRDAHAIGFGILCGLGLLLKITFPLFILPVFLCVWLNSGRRLRTLALSAASCLALALPWYAGHLRPTLAFAFDSGYGSLSGFYGTGPVWSIASVGKYLANVTTNGVSGYFLVLALAGAWMIRGRSSPAVPVLAAWLLPFAVLVFGRNKDVRFVAPLLPAAALAVAGVLDAALPKNRNGALLGGLLLGFPLLQMMAVSFGIPYTAAGGAYHRPYSRVTWPQSEILKLMAANSDARRDTREVVLVGTDRSAFNANNFELTAVALQLPFDVETTAYEKSFEALRQRLARVSFVVLKEGGEAESPAFNQYAGEFARYLAGDSSFRELPYAKRLPDGGVARIYRRAERQFTRAGVRSPEEFAIDFGGMLALTGFAVSSIGDATAVKLRWRCIRPPDRDYFCFTHLVDATGRIVAQADHHLLGGEPPLRLWRTGDGGEEELRLVPPAQPAKGSLRLRIGIYDAVRGDRLRVGPLTPAATARFSAADQSTALMTR
jgi:4-amino-4-deoxy-L-arabinose transferase-like glycosyltransferase